MWGAYNSWLDFLAAGKRRRGLLAELARRPDGLSAKGALAILDDASAAAPAESSGFELVPSAIAMDVA